MLERLTEAHVARRRRRPGPAVLLSIAAHVAAVAALLVAATSRIDKLETAEPPVLLAGIALPPPSGGDEAPPPKPKRPRIKRPIARDLVQPAAQTDEAAPREDRGQGPGPAGDGPDLFSCAPGQDCQSDVFVGLQDAVCGNGKVEGNEECDDGGRAAGDGCSPACAREVTVVPAKLVEGQRIAGDPQIPPPPRVHAAMLEKAQKQTVGTVRMCLDRSGSVRSLRVLRSTGYPLYDDLVTSRMQAWRYRPYQLSDGTAVPVCTAVTFIYRIE